MSLAAHHFKLARTPALTCAVALLAACGGKPDKDGGEGGQTIARVNGQEITVHELILEFDSLNERSDPDTATRKALRALVERSLLAQKAVEAKIHRSPEVMLALRRARMEVLARAYLMHRVANDTSVSDSDVHRYMDENPRRFEQREYFVLDQVVVEKGQLTDEDVSAIRKLKTSEEIMERLSAMGVSFVRQQNSFYSTDFPTDMLDGLEKLEPNQIFVVKTADTIAMSRIADRQPRPLTGGDAFEAAKRLLVGKKGGAVGRQVIQSLVDGAQIKYIGKYGAMAATPAGSATNTKSTPTAGTKPATMTRSSKTESRGPDKRRQDEAD